MGITSSRHNPETLSKQDECENTPKQTRILPFDPRSPPDNFCRTPIAVTSETPAKETETPINRKMKPIFLDPRSPTTQVIRTPISIEEQMNARKYQPTKPSKLIEGNLLSTTPSLVAARESIKDPRSPTIQVPRTPLEENEQTNFIQLSVANDEAQVESNAAGCLKDSSIFGTPKNMQQDLENHNTKTKLFSDQSIEKDRRPLSCLQNKKPVLSQNKNKVLTCCAVEDEFAKNETLILKKLVTQDSRLQTNTEFVEDI